MRAFGALAILCVSWSAQIARADTTANATSSSSATRATAPTPADADADRLVLNVAGDVAWPNGWGGIGIIDERQHELFELVRPILATGDLNFANLECPFTTTESKLKKTYPITCDPKRLAYVVDAGFNLLSLANNHALDAGEQGIIDTHALLRATTSDERPLWWAGTGESAAQANEPVFFTPPGKRTSIAFFALGNSGASSKVASLNAPDLTERIAAAAERADIVIVSVHYGPEYVHVPSKSTVDRYHALIDAGATLVVGHHAHVIQGVERYKRGFIFYNLGNFSFGSRTRRHLETGARMYSMIGRVTFAGRELREVELVPLYANNSKVWPLGKLALEPRHGSPQLLSGDFAQFAMDEMEQFASEVPTETPTRLVRLGDRLFADLGDGGPRPADEAARLHEQLHEYATAVAVDAAPRPATESEQQWANRAGTPLRVGPPEQQSRKRAAKQGKHRKARKAARKGRSPKSTRRKAKAKRRR